MALLLAEKAPLAVPTEYSDFINVFSSESAAELPKHTGIHDHTRHQARTATEAPLPLIKHGKRTQRLVVKEYYRVTSEQGMQHLR